MRNIWKDDAPALEEPLWRYSKVERFLDALKARSLYFAAAREFDDPFEGAVEVQPHDRPVNSRDGVREHSDRAFEELRRLTKVSCWHRADYESDAMWRLYSNKGRGLAVLSSPERLRVGLQPFRLAPAYGEEVPWWGSVRYVDLHSVRLSAAMEERFFYKHRAFGWEREFRMAVSLRMAEAFGARVPEHGINVPFDPATMIEAIYLGPHLAPDDRRRVLDGCEAASLNTRVFTSTLLGRPRYV